MQQLLKTIFVIICSLLLFAQSDDDDISFDDEIFDDEDVVDEPVLEKYVAGSTDDLGRLFDLEKRLLATLDAFMIRNAKTSLNPEVEKIQQFLVKYNIDGALLRSQVRRESEVFLLNYQSFCWMGKSSGKPVTPFN